MYRNTVGNAYICSIDWLNASDLLFASFHVSIIELLGHLLDRFVSNISVRDRFFIISNWFGLCVSEAFRLESWSESAFWRKSVINSWLVIWRGWRPWIHGSSCGGFNRQGIGIQHFWAAKGDTPPQLHRRRYKLAVCHFSTEPLAKGQPLPLVWVKQQTDSWLSIQQTQNSFMQFFRKF